MTVLTQIQQALANDGLDAEILHFDEPDGPADYLLLPLRIDPAGRAYDLVIQWLPADDDAVEVNGNGILSLSLTYPFYIANLEAVLDLMRLLLWLNRLLPFGRYGLQEDNRTVDFVYNWHINGKRDIGTNLLLHTIADITWQTEAHADIIEQVLSGAVSTDEVLEAIKLEATETPQPS